jgi:hypothetical protein
MGRLQTPVVVLAGELFDHVLLLGFQISREPRGDAMSTRTEQLDGVEIFPINLCVDKV